MKSAAERLRERTVLTPAGCLEYTGSLALGYGMIKDNGRQVRTHRLAYELAHGPIPQGAMVLHSCDNRACCNPDHLRLGTHAENMEDRRVRGRTAIGERCGRARLVPSQVRAIRARHAAGESAAALASEYDVNYWSIRNVVTRRTWSHI